MDANGCEPIVPNKISPCFTVWDVPSCVGVNVRFGKAEVDHIDPVLIGGKAYDAVPELNVTVQDAS
jgi:hypothetical protein